MYESGADFLLNFGLLITCTVVIIGIAVFILIFWLFLACVFDAFRKDSSQFPNRDIWIIIFAITFFTGFGWFIASVVYYFMYKPRLAFWR